MWLPQENKENYEKGSATPAPSEEPTRVVEKKAADE